MPNEQWSSSQSSNEEHGTKNCCGIRFAFDKNGSALCVHGISAASDNSAHNPPRSYDTEFSEPKTKTTRPERVQAAAAHHIGDGAGCLFRCESKRENKGLTPIVISAAKATPVRLTE